MSRAKAATLALIPAVTIVVAAAGCFGGRKITLALSEVPATAPESQRQGLLLVNPGGPGGSGLWLAADAAARLEPSVAADYDIVGFDPRGVGSSVPSLSCDPAFFARPRPTYAPANGAAEQVLEDRARQYAADCPATPPRVTGTGLPPILMLQGTLDPATPYQGAARYRSSRA